MAPLNEYRARIDEIDLQLISLLVQRLEICREVADYKLTHSLPTMQPERVRQVLERLAALADEKGLDPDFVKSIWHAIITEACAIEDRLRSEREDKGQAASEAEPKAVGDDALSLLETKASRIDHVVIAVPDLDRAVEFYKTRLGFRVLPRGEDGDDDSQRLVAGGVEIVLRRASRQDAGEAGLAEGGESKLLGLAIRVEALPLLRSDLQERGLALPSEIRRGKGCDRLQLESPGGKGAVLAFVERHRPAAAPRGES